ncbi:MAG: DUF5655 domain-containing protein [Anaerolineales bacterium]
MESGLPDLWTCPKCGAQFISKNLWHSCVTRISLQNLFAKCDPHVLDLFHKFEELVRACGPVTRIVQKSRVIFMVRVRFAGASPRKAELNCGFFLKREIASPRFWKIQHLGRSDWIQYIKVRSPREFDAEFKSWLREAYAVGEQRHLIAKGK